MPDTKNKNFHIVDKVDDFLSYLSVEKGSSPLTIRNYKHYLSRFNSWLIKNNKTGDLTDLDMDNVSKFRSHLASLKLSRKTQSYHAIAIRSFLKWLIKHDYKVMAPDKIELPKIEERQVKFLNGEQIDRLLNAPKIDETDTNTTKKLIALRDKAMLEVLFSTGLRVSELTSLNKDKIDFDRREFGITGKGGRVRVVFLSSRSTAHLKRYLDSRKDNFKPLFIRHMGKLDPSMDDKEVRLTTRSVERAVKKYVRQIRLPVDASVHTLRHSYATDLLIAGADMRSVQEMLGHKNIATTQIYTHVTNKRLREIHESYHHKDKDKNE